MTLRVEFVIPEGELWAGPAEMVIAKTLEGDIGVMTGHAPVLGILAEGSLVRIRPRPGADGEQEAPAGGDVTAAVSSGFFAVADDQVSILARQAQLGRDVDMTAIQAALEQALQNLEGLPPAESEPADVLYYRALLRAAGEPDSRA
jgi:F-type H+-transporting ATPase subunit epsilon